MNQNYTLASRPQTSRVPRGWAVLSRGTSRLNLADRRVEKKEVWNVN